MIAQCNVFSDNIRRRGYLNDSVYKSNNFFVAHASSFVRKLTPFIHLNINERLFDCDDKFILVFDGSGKDNRTLEALSQDSNYDRLIFWYWNPVKTSIHPSKVPARYEKWSYSPSDCSKYGLNFNTTFYFREYSTVDVPSIDSDVIFVGKDKGRKDVLRSYQMLFENQGLKTHFHITATRPRIQRIGYDTAIPYSELVSRTLGSRCIFDYYTDPEAGPSLRAMESIFLRRKLITNNTQIATSDFYHRQNMFILGRDEEHKLRDFAYSPYVDIDPEVVEKYEFGNWIRRFGV